MRPSAAPQWRFTSRGCKAKSRYAHLRPKGKASRCSSSTQGRTLAMLGFNPRVHPHYLYPWCKGKVSLHLPSTQGWALTMLILNARANPCYTQLQPKSAYSLSLPMIQGRSLAMLPFDPSARPHNPHPWSKSESELTPPSMHEQSLTELAFDLRGEPSLPSVLLQSLYHSFVLYHTTTSIYYISFIYISVWTKNSDPKTLTQSSLNSTSLYKIFILSCINCALCI